MSIEAYIEEEQEQLCAWPKEPDEWYENRQYFTLAKALIENVRNNSIRDGIKPEDYGERINEAREIFDDLRWSLNYEDNMTEEQKQYFDDQTFWRQNELYDGGLLDKKQDIWPISRDELILATKRYLQKPFMWSDTLDYILTDAFIYAEVSSYRERLLAKYRFPEIYGTKWKSFYKVTSILIKWAGISFVLVISYQESKEIFMLIGMAVIAYQSVKTLKDIPKDEEWELYEQMVMLYQSCNYSHYNASVIWDMCMKVHDKGAIFDSVMYNLLEKQIKRHNNSFN